MADNDDTNIKRPETQVVGFTPLNDNVLIKMDVVKKSALLLDQDKPKVIPSGIVLAVGRGVFIPGTGFVGNQVKPGDHVAISMEGSWVSLPLAQDRTEVYIAVSESLILGKLQDAAPESPWFAMGDDSASGIIAAKGRR